MFDLADIWARRTGEGVRLVSANDHVHSRASAHYAGLAIDLHSTANDALARVLRAAGYAVLWNVRGHFSHVHVQATRPAGGGAATSVGGLAQTAPARRPPSRPGLATPLSPARTR